MSNPLVTHVFIIKRPKVRSIWSAEINSSFCILKQISMAGIAAIKNSSRLSWNIILRMFLLLLPTAIRNPISDCLCSILNQKVPITAKNMFIKKKMENPTLYCKLLVIPLFLRYSFLTFPKGCISARKKLPIFSGIFISCLNFSAKLFAGKDDLVRKKIS